ncbi:MAG: hypothetical protein M1518_00910 [Candidatus Thermoplasmatota archaeon]|jgi:rRNA pseudouridine-1189 N-methylase Emg1 (Nep1/Mra1 family)|nr:hypothetical protein [Candidatus Thermoplasmatota archaeon]
MFIVLADAELELVPERMRDDKEVRDLLKRMGKETAILDNYLMRDSIKRHFPNEVRRIGFPDIAYEFVRINEESPLNDSIDLEYAIHTKNNTIIEKSDFGNFGAGYPEFVERVERILIEREKRTSLMDYLESKGIIGSAAVLHPRGNPGLVITDQSNLIIGGFPNGDFVSNMGSLRKFSIHEREITVPGVLELIHFRLFQP